LIPFFALVGLVTIISIIVYLQVNRHSLLCQIVGTAILIFACVFAFFVMFYPLKFGSYQNLIVSFGVAFIIMIGIYIAAYLLTNRKKNVVYIDAEGTADADKTSQLTKPVSVRYMAVPKANDAPRRVLQAPVSEHKYPVMNNEARFEQFVLNDVDTAEKEEETVVTQSDYSNSLFGSNKTETGDIGIQTETESIQTQAAQVDGGIDETDVAEDDSEAVSDTAVTEAETEDSSDTVAEDNNEAVIDTAVTEAETEDSGDTAEEDDSEAAIDPVVTVAETEDSSDTVAEDDSEAAIDTAVTVAETEDIGDIVAEDDSEAMIDTAVTEAETEDSYDTMEEDENEAVSDTVVTEAETEDSGDTAEEDDSEAAIDPVVTEAETEDSSDTVAEDDSEAAIDTVVTEAETEDKYLRLIAKASELKNQGQYPFAIVMLQSGYPDMTDNKAKKQADILFLECYTLSKQYEQGQKKWFEMLNHRYDFEPEEKAKIKAIMAQLKAAQQ